MSLLGRIFGGHAGADYQRGMSAFNAGHPGEALAAFERALRYAQDPSDPVRSLALFYAAEAAAELGLQRLAADEPRAALRLFERALEWNSHFPDLHCYAGAAHARLGELAAARAGLAQALDLDPEHLEARCLLALVLQDGGDREAAADELERVAEEIASPRRPLRPWLRHLLEPQAGRMPGLGTALNQLESASRPAADAGAAR